MKGIVTLLVVGLLLTATAWATDQPAPGKMQLGIDFGVRSIDTDPSAELERKTGECENDDRCSETVDLFFGENRETVIGIYFRGWESRSWSVGGELFAGRDISDISGRVDVAWHWQAIYVPIIVQYMTFSELHDTFAFGTGLGVGFMAGENVRLEIEFDGLYPKSGEFKTETGKDLVLQGRVGIGFVF